MKISLRSVAAMADALLCDRIPSRARYQAALLTAEGTVMPVDAAAFHNRTNADWWVYDYGPGIMPDLHRSLGARWVVIDL